MQPARTVRAGCFPFLQPGVNPMRLDAMKARLASPAKRPARSRKQASLPVRKRLALLVGGIGVALLCLSLYHVTEAVSLLTDSPLLLAFLLATGVDAGMVACELASILDHTGPSAKWSNLYVCLSLALSAVLNGYANSLTAPVPVLAWSIGLAIPGLVFILFRVSGHLWR